MFILEFHPQDFSLGTQIFQNLKKVKILKHFPSWAFWIRDIQAVPALGLSPISPCTTVIRLRLWWGFDCSYLLCLFFPDSELSFLPSDSSPSLFRSIYHIQIQLCLLYNTYHNYPIKCDLLSSKSSLYWVTGSIITVKVDGAPLHSDCRLLKGLFMYLCGPGSSELQVLSSYYSELKPCR